MTRARLYASARGVYRADRYRAYDVTGLLRPGRNALGAMIGDGWWCGFVGFDPRRGG